MCLQTCKTFTDSHDRRTRNSAWAGFAILKALQLRCFVELRFQERRSGTIQDRQDATVKFIRGTGVPRIRNALTCLRVFKRQSPNGAGPSAEMS
eukprot:4671928-Pyramimonas_sp.AAC.1